MKKFMTQRKIYIYAERVIHGWSHTEAFFLGILNIYIFFILKKNMFIVKFHNQTEKNDLYILHHVLWSDLKPLIHFQTSSALKTVKPFGCFNMSHGFD